MGRAARGRVGLLWAGLAALVLLGGTAEPVLRHEAAAIAAARVVSRAVPAAAVNRLPAGALPAVQTSPPSPSGAHPPYPVNHTFDAARTFPGSPP